MDELTLKKVWRIIQDTKDQLKRLQTDLDFSFDVSIQTDGINHPLAIQARELDWKPQRHDASAWYEKSDEYGQISVFVE